MLFIAGIDAFGRISDVEIRPDPKPGTLPEDRHAFLFDRAGIDGGFVDDNVALFERGADRARGFEHGAEIGPSRLIDGGWNRYDEKIGTAECGLLARKG